jgi:DNA-binding transcriptional ArsR family regulator
MDNKFELLNADLFINASEMLKAMAHPMRIAILRLLNNGKSLSVSEIHEMLDISQSCASHHLSIMKNKNIVVCKRKGKNIFYSISQERISTIIDCVQKCTV